MAELQTVEPLMAYCVYCKHQVEILDLVIKTSDSGRRMAMGRCITCKKKVNKVMR